MATPLSRHCSETFNTILIIVALSLSPLGCQPDESPLRGENDNLRKQLAKQESVVVSLQEGNKVMQQQIDLLNQELRDAKQQVERVLTEQMALAGKLDAQEGRNRKLAEEAQRMAQKASQMSQALRVDDKSGSSEDFPRALSILVKAAEDALSKHGYALRVSIKMDQKVVYVTDRKVSMPASLEATGFRNQYLVSMQALSTGSTRLTVKADFERMTQGNRMLPTGQDETSEIERRLIAEISKSLTAGKV